MSDATMLTHIIAKRFVLKFGCFGHLNRYRTDTRR